MKKFSRHLPLLLSGLLLILTFSCSKETPIVATTINGNGTRLDNNVQSTATVIVSLTTKAVTEKNNTTAIFSGSLQSTDQTLPRGFCWDKNPSPTITKSKLENGTGSGDFESEITGLEPGTTYYVRAYVTLSKKETVYGNQVSFTKLGAITYEVNATKTTKNSAECRGKVFDDVAYDIKERGILCWLPPSGIAKAISDNNPVKGELAVTINDLAQATTYHFKAYMITKGQKWFFGPEKAFKTNVVDASDNEYHVVTIGTQFWMLENLRTTKYNDGSLISNPADKKWNESTTGAYCYYGKSTNTDFIRTYGALYNSYAVNNSKLCPSGWKVPTKDDWQTLFTYLNLDGKDNAGGHMKEKGPAHWYKNSALADNSSGFTALPGGYRDSNGFAFSTAVGYWWAAKTNTKDNEQYIFFLNGGVNTIYPGSSKKGDVSGYSVRCLATDHP